jgi:hypothetical protein
MFKALSRLFSSKPKKAPRLSIPVAGAAASVKSSSVPAATAPLSAKEKWEADAARALSRQAPPEALAGLTADLTPEQIAERLAKLYQRHNRAASSLDPKLREEAEFMLETLAALREKYIK